MVVDFDVSRNCLYQLARQIIKSNSIDHQGTSSLFQIIANQNAPVKLIVSDQNRTDGELLRRLLANLENFPIFTDLQQDKTRAQMLAQNIHFLTNIIHADKQHQDAVINLFDCTSTVVLELRALFVQLLQRDFRFVDRADIKYCLVVRNSVVIRVEWADNCVGSAAKSSSFFALFLFITVIAVVMRVVVSEVGLKKAGVVGRFV